MSFACPKCHSENTQKLSIIYGAGTSGVDLSTVGAGVASGLGVGVAATTGKTQSGLAKKYAPPQKIDLFAPTVALLVIGGFLSIFLGAVAFYIAVGIAVFFVFRAVKHNTKQYPAEFAKWNKKFLCLRCENVFELEAK
jgi:hypothetical protein